MRLENSGLFSWITLREEAFQIQLFAMQNLEVSAGISVGSFGPLFVASSCARGKTATRSQKEKIPPPGIFQDVIVGLKFVL